MKTWFSPLHEDDMGNPARIVGTVLLLGAAMIAPFGLSVAGIFLGLLLIIVWYSWIGHHFTGLFVERLARSMQGRAVDPSTVFEPQVLELIQQGQPEKALETCHAWVRHDARTAAPHLMTARVLATHLHGTDRAVQTLELALLRPMAAEDLVSVALYLAELYRRMGREAEISPVFHRLRGLYPRSPAIARLPPASP